VNDPEGGREPTRFGLNVAGLSEAERTALRELTQGQGMKEDAEQDSGGEPDGRARNAP